LGTESVNVWWIMITTIDNLLIQDGFWDNQVESKQRNDAEGKALIKFDGCLEYSDCNANIMQVLVIFDPTTKYIKAFKLYGTNLQGVCDYLTDCHHFLWNEIAHYTTEFDYFPQTMTLFTTYSMM